MICRKLRVVAVAPLVALILLGGVPSATSSPDSKPAPVPTTYKDRWPVMLTRPERMFFVKVTAPRPAAVVGRDFVVSGKTDPNGVAHVIARIHRSAAQARSRPGGQVVAAAGMADRKGYFKVALHFGDLLLKGDRIQIFVKATDPMETRTTSEEIEFYVVVGGD